MVTFTAHLSITIQHLTRYTSKHKVVFAAMLANTNHTTLLKNQSTLKYLASCVSSQISGVRKFLSALSNFGISKIPTHCLKEALVMWPLSASGLFPGKWHLRKKTEILYWWHITTQCFWLVVLPGKFASTNQKHYPHIWVVMHHQCRISALVSQRSLQGETIGGIAKCWLFSQANRYKSYLN